MTAGLFWVSALGIVPLVVGFCIFFPLSSSVQQKAAQSMYSIYSQV